MSITLIMLQHCSQGAQFHTDPRRADELEAIFAEGFDKPVMKKIWPGFRRIVAVGTFPFRIYTDGLKRYADDDIIHVVRMKDTVPVFTYVRRYYDICSAGSAELSLNDFEKVIPELEREAGIDIRDYCIEADKELNAFHLMIELLPVETLRPDTGDPDMQQLSQTAERLFCRQFDSYAEERKTGAIAPVHVSLLEPETQLLYRDKCAVSQKCSEAQLKPVRILDTMEKSQFFHAFIVK